MSGRPSASQVPDRKVRETVSMARPGSSSNSTRAPASSSGGAPLSYAMLGSDPLGSSLGSSAGSARGAPSPAKKPAASAPADDYDDDFEPYENEEFETEEEPVAVKAPPKVSAPSVTTAPAAPVSKPASKAGPSAASTAAMAQEANQVAAARRGQADEMQEVLRSVQQENSAAMNEAKRRPRDDESSKDGPGAEERPRFAASLGRGRGPNSSAPGAGNNSPGAADAGHTDGAYGDSQPKASRRPRKFGGMDMHSENVAAGPRESRLRSLRGLLDMRTDSFVHLNLTPMTKYETYQRVLRANPPIIAQETTSTVKEHRDIDVGTDPIEQVHREVQVGLGDEIDLLNIIKCIKERRASGRKTFKRSLLEEAGVAPAIAATKSDSASGSGAQDPDFEVDGGSAGLSSFLQRSSHVMESLIVEAQLRDAQKTGKRDAPSSRSASSYRLPDTSPDSVRDAPSLNIFSDAHPWVVVGKDASSGYIEYVKNRPPSIVRFSTLQPNVMVTCHPAPDNEKAAEEDIKPNSALYCIWDVLSCDHPTRILAGPGVPSAVSFSATQSFLVLAGTVEGSVHMWDLREANSMHLDRDAMDLKVLTGVRKACFSSYEGVADAFKGSSSTSPLVLFDSQHTGAIIQIESVDPTGGQGGIAVSQFVTIDDSGLLVIWLSSVDIALNGVADLSAVQSVDDKEEIGLSPHSNIKLVKHRVIRPDCRIFYQPAPGNPSEPLFAASTGVLPVFAVSPWDPSVLYVAVGKGAVYKGSCGGSASNSGSTSSGNANAASYFKRFSSSRVVVDAPVGVNSQVIAGSDSSPAVTCIAVSPRVFGVFGSDKSAVSFVLVGRVDGSVDLFASNSDTMLLSWQLNSEAEIADKSNSVGKARSVVSLKWLPGSTSSFVAVDNLGVIYSFDLCKSTDHAVEVDTSANDSSGKAGASKALHRARVDVSSNHSMGAFSACFVAMCRYKKGSGSGALISDGVLRVRRVDPMLIANVSESMSSRANDNTSNKRGSESKYSDDDASSANAKGNINEWISDILPGRMGRDASSGQVRLVLRAADTGSAGGSGSSRK